MKKEIDEIGKRIRQARTFVLKTYGISNGEFSKKLGFDYNTVTAYERGERTRKPRFFSSLENQFGISKKWILFGEGNMTMQDSEDKSDRTETVIRDEDIIAELIKYGTFQENAEISQMVFKLIAKIQEAGKPKRGLCSTQSQVIQLQEIQKKNTA